MVGKKQIENNLRKLQEEYDKEFPGQRITKSEYEKRGGYTEDEYSPYFYNFKELLNELFPAVKVSQEVKDRLLEKAFKFYEENKDDCPVCLSRDFFVKNSGLTKHVITSTFGTYSAFITAFKKKYGIKDAEDNPLTRDSFNIEKEEHLKKGKRRYFVTCAASGSEISMPFLGSIKTFCKEEKAELMIHMVRGVKKKDTFLPHVLKEIEQYVCTKVKFNANLQSMDFRILPSMIKPLTGLARFGSKETSLIIASPKQMMESVPVSNRTLPHVLYSTGTISIPEYADDRQGALGSQDNTLGGLIVEIENDEIFHIRIVTADKHGCFYDLNKYYTPKRVQKIKNIEAFVMGDLHCGSEDEKAIKVWKEVIHLTNPKYIVFHDIMDSMSINRHQEKNVVYNANLPAYAKTLESEVNLVGSTLKQWADEFKKSTLVITKGNHDTWLDIYLQEGKYARPEQAHNHRFALSLANYVLDHKNPLEEYINSKFNIKNIKWLKIDEDFIILKNQLGYHGAKGSNSGRNSAAALELARGAGMYGHSHSPQILRDTMIIGTSTKLKLDYNKDGASSWLHASGLLYPSGKKTLIISVEGKYKI